MPKRVDHDERRDEVAAVAERLIAERGLEVGVLDVARAGGWSSSVVTHYFASKRELLEHTMRRSLERASQAADARVAAGQSRLQAIIEETLPLDASRRRRARLFLVFWGRAVHDATLLEHQRRRHVRFRSTLAALLEAELGSDRGRDPELEARRLFALLDGVVVQAVFEPRLWPARVQIEIVNRHLADLGLVLDGDVAA
ncbi:MAG: TetR family transcriptional regulator C-terminal domain-containing protein [Myxococcota bacterium]|nr:TetR family transcriptional regulator C-terminal domain-containing protein [Myxococcota bacterium]